MQLPDALLRTLAITATRSENGAEMRGADRLYNYEQVLRQVTYTNQKPAYYLNRQFKLVCSELNERFVSNEYVQTVRYFFTFKQLSVLFLKTWPQFNY
jgi:hypothetical protein